MSYGTQYYIEMGCFGRVWQRFVQQNVQQQEFCATGFLRKFSPKNRGGFQDG
jgi:hypothetical protein